jgi:O-antigen/teichoic acid export membrane protein
MKIYLYKIFFQVKDVINIVKGFTIGTIIQQLIIFLSIPIFTRLLPPEELGIFMLFTAFSLVVSHLTWFGSNQSIIKQYPEIKNNDNKKYLSSIYSFSSLFILGLFLLITIVYSITGFDSNLVPSLTFYPFLILCFLHIFCETPFNIILSKYRSENNHIKYNYWIIISASLSVIFSILIIYFFETGVVGRILGSIFSYICFYIFIFFKKYLTINFNFKLFKQAFNFGIFLSIQWVFLEFYNYYSYSVIESNISTEFLGVLSVHRSIGLQIPSFIVSSVELAFVPLYFKTYNSGLVKSFFKSYWIYIFLLSFFIIIFISLYNPLFYFLADSQYHSLMWIGPVFAISAFIRAFMFIPLYHQYVNENTSYVMLVFILSTFIMLLYLFFNLNNLSNQDVIFILVMPNILNTFFLSLIYFFK